MEEEVDLDWRTRVAALGFVLKCEAKSKLSLDPAPPEVPVTAEPDVKVDPFFDVVPAASSHTESSPPVALTESSPSTLRMRRVATERDF